MDTEDLILYAAIGYGAWLILQQQNPRNQPAVVQQSPNSGFSVAIPGIGGFQSTRGGSSLVLDPSIVNRLFPTRGGQTVPYPGGFTPYPGSGQATDSPYPQPPATQDYVPQDSPPMTTPGFDDYRAGERSLAVDQPPSFPIDPVPAVEDFYPPDTGAESILDPCVFDPWACGGGLDWLTA